VNAEESERPPGVPTRRQLAGAYLVNCNGKQAQDESHAERTTRDAECSRDRFFSDALLSQQAPRKPLVPRHAGDQRADLDA